MIDTRCNAAAALVLGLLVAAPLAQKADAQSDQKSANFYVPRCQKFVSVSGNVQQHTREDAFEIGLCGGLIAGLSYTVESLPPQGRACPPSTATNTQMVRVVLAYIERRPQRMHEDFRGLAIEALHEAWPCPQR